MVKRVDFKKWANRLLLLLFLAGWASAAAATVYCGLSASCGSESSGWWQLFLAVFAVPVVVLELYTLRRSFQESVWKPILDVELLVSLTGQIPSSTSDATRAYSTNLDLNTLLEHLQVMDAEVNEFSVAADMNEFFRVAYPFLLVIRNEGKRAARFIKLRIKPDQFPGDRGPIMVSKTQKLEHLPDEQTAVVHGGEAWVIYPQDLGAFQIGIVPKNLVDSGSLITLSLEYEFGPSHIHGQDGDLYKKCQSLLLLRTLYPRGEYVFECTVWAEGIDTPVQKKLGLTIIDSKADEHEDMLRQARERAAAYSESLRGRVPDADF